MSELYWITVLGNLCCFLDIVTIISIVVCVIFFIILGIAALEDLLDESSGKMIKSCLKYSVITTICLALLSVFCPAKKELLTIFALGTTIDYIQSNEVAKQLPDKCIKAFDIFISEYTETKK